MLVFTGRVISIFGETNSVTSLQVIKANDCTEILTHHSIRMLIAIRVEMDVAYGYSSARHKEPEASCYYVARF